MSFFVGVCSPQILRRPLQIMEASFFHLQGGLSWHQKQKSWSCTGFVNWTASCWPSKTFSLSTLASKTLHAMGADNCMALENALCRRCWPETQLLLSLQPGWARSHAWHRLEQREGHRGHYSPVRLSLHHVLLCRELLGRSPPLEVLQAAR